MSAAASPANIPDVSATAWHELGNYLKQTTLTLIDESKRETFLAQWDDVTRQEEHLEDALLIGLVGGTGVGKSTFINAMARTEISRSSDRRPTTSRVVVYRHVDTEVPADVPVEDFSQPPALHRNEHLSKVILFDFPDFDSAEESHGEIIERYLPFLDVLLIIVDDVKYGDRRLYELLSRLDHAATNLFVILNKVDRLRDRYADKTPQVIEEMQADLREKLAENAQINVPTERQFAVSARSAFQADGHTSAAADSDFEKVESMIANYQHDKHRRAAKERNIDARKRQLVDDVSGAALGSENHDILAETKDIVIQWRGELGGALDRISQEILAEPERRGLRGNQLRRVGPNWGLPFSLLFTLLGEFRRSKSRAITSDTSEFGSRIFQHYRAFFEALSNLRARLSAELVGLDNRSAAEDLPQVMGTGEVESLSTKMAREFQARINRDISPPSRFRKLLAHIPAAFVFCFGIWQAIYPVLAKLAGESDRGWIRTLLGATFEILSPTFVLGLILSTIIAYLVTAGVLWLRTVQHLDIQVLESEKSVRDQVRDHGRQYVNSLESDVNSMYSEFEALTRSLAKK